MHFDEYQEEKIYNLILEFLKVSGLSNRKFALFAGVPPTTFQNMLNNRSKIKYDTLSLIVSAICDYSNFVPKNNDENNEIELELDDISGDITDIFLNVHVDDDDYEIMRRDAINRFQALDQVQGPAIVNQKKEPKFSQITTPKRKFDIQRFAEMPQENDILTRLNIAFDTLNEQGLKKAIEQVEMLSKIPEYRKNGD